MTGPGQWTLAFHVLNLIRLNTYLNFTDISRSTHLPMQALTTRQTGPLVIQVFLLCKFCRTYRFPSDIVVQIWVNNPAHRRLLNPSNLKSKTFSKSGDNISDATTLYHCTLPATEHLGAGPDNLNKLFLVDLRSIFIEYYDLWVGFRVWWPRSTNCEI